MEQIEFHDTLWASRKKLPNLENHQLQTVAAACGYNLENHHHALADAEACAWMAREIIIMEESQIVIYQTEDGQTQFDVRLENETV